jgi:hypothetical protein
MRWVDMRDWFLFNRSGAEDVRRGFRGLRSDLIRLAGILALIGALCAPGIIGKLVGLLEIGIAGASPAINVGTVIVQTTALTLALPVAILLVANYAAADEASLVGRVRAFTAFGGFAPLSVAVFLPMVCVALFFAATTYTSDRLGHATGISLHRVWDDTQPATLSSPVKAVLSFGTQYLKAYGLSTFLSALVIGYFMAGWIAQLSRYFLDIPSDWLLGWSSEDGVVVCVNKAGRATPRYVDGLDEADLESVVEAFVNNRRRRVDALPWKDVPSTAVPPEVASVLTTLDSVRDTDAGTPSITIRR